MAAELPDLQGLVGAVLLLDITSAGWVKALGWVGQAFFSGRVLVQWIASERARRPVAPQLFWWLSLFGAVQKARQERATCRLRPPHPPDPAAAPPGE